MILEEDKAFARAMLGDEVVNAAEENAVLMHEGVKGMKWGIWNAETRARRLRERGLKKARKAKAKKAKEAKVAAKKEEQHQAKLRDMSNQKVLKMAQNEFKKKVYDKLRNVESMSLSDFKTLKEQVDAGEKLLNVSFKDKEQKSAFDKIMSAAKKTSSTSKTFSDLFANIGDLKKNYKGLFTEKETSKKDTEEAAEKVAKTAAKAASSKAGKKFADKFADAFYRQAYKKATVRGIPSSPSSPGLPAPLERLLLE